MTKLTNIKDNIPIYVEQKFIQTDLQAKDILKTRTLIPSKFVKLEIVEGNYICSTNPKWKNKPLCERYGFTHEGEWIYLDISHALMKKLGLEKKEDIIYQVYINPKVLDREPVFGGINIESEKEIFIQKPFQKDQSTQTELTDSEITSLDKEKNKIKLLLTKTQSLRVEKKELLTQIKDLEKGDNLNQQTILNLQGELADLEERLTNLKTELVREKQTKTQLQNNLVHRETDYQTQINNLQTEITQLNNTLQTTQQEKDQIQQSLKRSLLGSLFKDKRKRKRINELNNSLSFLRGLLSDKNQQVNNLTTEQNDLQNQVNQLTNQINELNRQLTNVNNRSNELRDEVREVEEERDNRPNTTLAHWNDTRQQLAHVQTQLNNRTAELNDTRNKLDEYRNKWDNHTCHCSRTHYVYEYGIDGYGSK